MHRTCIFLLLFIAFSNAQKAIDTFSITTLDSLFTSGLHKTAAFDTLAGPLPDTVKSGKNVFLVVGDIEVPINRTVVIYPGTIFLFKNFTGLHVQGKLIAHGTKDLPIIFSSENDRSCNPLTKLLPNPFDWNGIYVHPEGVGTELSFCKVLYSVYGIISETKFIKFEQITLKLNGKSNLTVEGKEVAGNDQPYSNFSPTKNVPSEAVPVQVVKDPFVAKREILRYGSLTIAMMATAGTLYCATMWNKSQNDLKQMNANDNSTRQKRDRYMFFSSASGLIAILGFAGFAWSFTF
jgi:hypothetical protein